MGEPIRTPVGTMWIDDAGLLWHRLDTGAVVDLDHTPGIHAAIREVSRGRPVRAVVDISGVRFADRSARNAFAKPVDDLNEVATALVVDSPMSRAMGTLFLKLSRPARPVRLFLDADEAARWVTSVPLDT